MERASSRGPASTPESAAQQVARAARATRAVLPSPQHCGTSSRDYCTCKPTCLSGLGPALHRGTALRHQVAGCGLSVVFSLQMSRGGGGGGAGPARSTKNILYAVMALMSELEEEDLVYVRREIEQRIGRR
jgi:hypothetical protein